MLLVLLCLAADWPQWRGPNRDNVCDMPGLPDKLPAKLVPRWKRPLGGGYGGIAVVGDRVYVMDRRKTPEAERIVCLDAKDGKTLWEHAYSVAYGRLDYGNGPRGTPTVLGGKVFALGALGHLHALDAKSGCVHWVLDDAGSRTAPMIIRSSISPSG